VKTPKSEIRNPNRLVRAWRVLWATPAQRVAVDAVLGGPVAVPSAKSGTVDGAWFDEVERVLSVALDAVLNAVDSYRDRKKGGV